jgi:hypothetical protein
MGRRALTVMDHEIIEGVHDTLDGFVRVFDIWLAVTSAITAKPYYQPATKCHFIPWFEWWLLA